MAINLEEAIKEVSVMTGYTESHVKDKGIVVEIVAKKGSKILDAWCDKDDNIVIGGTPVGYMVVYKGKEGKVIPYDGMAKAEIYIPSIMDDAIFKKKKEK